MHSKHGLDQLGLALAISIVGTISYAQAPYQTSTTPAARHWHTPTNKPLAHGSLLDVDRRSGHVIVAADDNQTVAIPLAKLGTSDQTLAIASLGDSVSAGQVIAAAVPPKGATQQILSGKVIGIADGDTLTILVDQKPVKIRMEAIDAPENSQPFGRQSKRLLSKLTFGKQAIVIARELDRYKRTVGAVYCDGHHVNREMIRAGLAWHFKRYSDDETLAALERDARAARRGLWADTKSIPPWEWRRLSAAERAVAVSGRTAPVASSAPSPEQSTRSESKPDGAPELSHWLNTKSNVRHNSSCRWFGTTKRGRKCTADEGKPCGQCGG